MRILCINTAFANSDVAICFDNITDYVTLPSSAKQSENILVAVDDILSKHNICVKDFDCVSCVVGPGSFTGVRIGVALLKGMKLAKPELNLIKICSLDLMAYGFNKQSDFWCVQNALSGNIFACKYDSEGNRLTEPEMLYGEKLEKITGEVLGLCGENMEIAKHNITLDAKLLLEYSISLAKQQKFCSESEFLPIYLRKSQAECQLEEKNGN